MMMAVPWLTLVLLVFGTGCPLLVNANPPTPTSTTTSLAISEDTPLDTLLMTCTANDADLEGTYYTRIAGGNEGRRFSMTAQTCELNLLNPLDAETTKVYHLTIVTEDNQNQQSSPLTVTIYVEDANDNAPNCENYVIVGTLPETASPGTNIAQFDCSDKDSESPGNVVKYEVINEAGTDVTIIDVNQDSGVATLKESVNFDGGQSSFHVKVNIYDNNGATGALTSTGTVYLYVSDADDETPTFPYDSYSPVVSEDVAVGHTIVTVSASSRNSQVTYGFESAPSPDLIVIGPKTGDVMVKKPLDRETASTITAVVTAYPGTNTAKMAKVDLTVTVNDVNDNRPVFSPRYQSGNVDENSQAGTVVLNSAGTSALVVTATDADTGNNAIITYSIDKAVPAVPANIFSINSSGIISLESPPDYETATAYLLTVKATDGGMSPLSSVVPIQVKINPVNEFAPVFKDPTTFEVSEDKLPGFALGTTFPSLTVTDEDHGVDGQVEFSIPNPDIIPFSVDRNSGNIRVSGALDAITNPSYSFIVRATDKSGTTKKSTDQSITVTVTRAKDHPPTCAEVGTQVIPDPNSIGYIVANLRCTDPEGGTLTYTLSSDPSTTVFTMEDKFVKLSAIPEAHKYTLTVDVESSTMLSTKVSFVVVTETQMTLTIDPIEIPVDEGFTGYLTNLKITWGGVFEFTQVAIIRGLVDDRTILFSTSGQMAVVAPYDYEEHRRYEFTILATSRFGQEAVGTVIINVNDVNDNTPVFSPILNVLNVAENHATGPLHTYTATDADADVMDTLTYKVDPDNFSDKFELDSATGGLSLKQKLSYPDDKSFTLVIVAEDRVGHQGTATVVVTVDPEVAPATVVFVPDPAVTSKSIPETQALGSELIQVSATDPDPNLVFTYSFKSGNSDNAFLIDGSTGKVYVQNLLDRETHATYTLVIQAVDQNLATASVTFSMTITDVNDNDPVFTPDVFEMYVDHGTVSGTSVGDITVSDPDDSTLANGQFTVSIVTATVFTLVQVSPTVYTVETAAKMDYESATLFTFQVQAVDNGSPQRTGTAMVAVHVRPDIDQPKFDPTSATVSLKENVEPGTQIYDLDATVLGTSELDSTIRYSISPSTSTTSFAVRSDTGQVVVSSELDYETTPLYTLEFVACYTQSPPACSSGTEATFTMTISILNENDNTPTFDQEAYVETVSEDANVGTEVKTITATDGDTVPDTVTYTLTGSSTDFAVDSSTGQISVKSALDYARKNSYYYILTATDNGSPPKSGITAVIISVKDENNHDPVFTSGNTTDVIDSAPIGADIFHFHATDVDTGAAGTLTYSITGGSTALTTFKLDPASGILSTKVDLNAVLTSSYTVDVTVQDGGSPTRSATTTLTITVVSTVPNRHDPAFSPSTATRSIARLESAGYTVYTASATDADTGAAGEVTHKLLSGNTDGYFLIDSSTGVITTATTLLLAANTYTLVVQAVDDGLPQRSGTMTLTVTIIPDATISITFDYSFKIQEDKPTGTEVGRINVDPNRVITAYTISEGGHGAFSIATDAGDGNKGVITTASSLDYEAFPKYALLVTVTTDIGPLDKFVEIEVVDVNDNAPCFSPNTLSFSIVEGLPVGTTVATISYTDADTLAANRDNTLTLKAPDGDLFSLTQAGALVLDTVPDYELKTNLQFEILVADKTKSSLGTCTMSVTASIIDLSEDVNVYLSDITTNALMNFEFPCQSSPGDVIYTLLPQDFGINPPTGATAEFITNFNSGPVNVDSSTGTITISNNQLTCHESYIRWVACRVSSGGTVVESRVSLLKMTTFDWATEMIVLTFGETEAHVRANLACFRKRIQRLFSSTQRFGTAQMREVTTDSRRRLLATSTNVFAYGVADTEADKIENINTPKTFMTKEQLLALIQSNQDGSTHHGISDSSFLTVNSAEPFVASHTNSSSDTTFFETPAGITVLVMICLFIIVLTAITVYCVIYQRQRNQRREKVLHKDQ